MKSKFTTRALAVLLAVVMSFSLIIPETFATGNDVNETEDDGYSIEMVDESQEEAETDNGLTYDPGFAQRALEEYQAVTPNILDIPITLASDSVFMTKVDHIDYPGYSEWGSSVFNTQETGESAQVAYCVEPSNYAPAEGTYAKNYDVGSYIGGGGWSEESASRAAESLRKILWYMPGCPGYEAGVEAGIWPDTWPVESFTAGTTEWQMQYMAGHLLLGWYFTYDIDDALAGMDETFTQWFKLNICGNYGDDVTYYNSTGNMIYYRMPSPPDSFKIYLLNWDASNPDYTQILLGWEYEPSGYMKVIKTTDNADLTGNSNYDMSGAQYTAYTDYACTDIAQDTDGNNAVMTIAKTSNNTYESNVLEMTPGTYYVKETKVPDGFNADSTIYTAVVDSNYTEDNPLIIYSTDYTLGSFLRLEKSSSNPEFTDNNNCYSFAGAQYTVYTDSSCKNVARTFDYGDGVTEDAILTVNAEGVSNEIALYAGHYYVKETKLPDPVGDNTESSYGWDKTVYEVDMTSNPNDHITVYASDPPGNDPISLTIHKDPSNISAEDAPSLTGAQFLISFYGGDYTEAEIDAGKPASDGVQTRTWIIETKYVYGAYIAALYEDYLVDSTTVNGVTYTSDKLYYDDGLPTIPYGTITIEELQAPEGYSDEGAWSEQVINGVKTTTGLPNNRILYHVEEDLGYFQDLTITYTRDDPIDIWGGLTIQKIDAERDTNIPQGDATLAGAEYTIYYSGYDVNDDGVIDSKDTITYTDKKTGQEVTLAPDDPVITIVTDEDGIATTAGSPNVKQSSPVLGDKTLTEDNTLLYGRYYVKETKASTGYLLNEDFRYDFFVGAEVDENGNIVRDANGAVEFVENAITAADEGPEQVIRGGFEIEKRDLESGYNKAEGGANLRAQLTVYNESENAVLVNGELYQPGDVVLVLYTDPDTGWAGVDGTTLPYGTYHIVETVSPEGYLPDDEHKENTDSDSEPVGVLERDLVIREDGKVYDLTDQTYDFDKQAYVSAAQEGMAIYNQVIRADFAIRKIDGETQRRMSGIVFKIESLTTGEYHYFMTDENGAYSSAVEYAEHSYKTNYNDDESTWNETDEDSLRDHTGLWFNGYGNDDEGALVDNSLGALPYDTYKITEVRTAANEGYNLWEDTFTVGPNDNNIVVDLNDIEDTIIIFDTYAEFDETDSKYSPTSEYTFVTDEIVYQGLTRGDEYTFVTKLYDLDTQNFVYVNGSDVIASTTFTCRTATGTLHDEFMFDSTGLEGHTVVVFEYLYKGTDVTGQPYFSETEPENADQMLYFPGVGTTATDQETGVNVSYASTEITIVDTVEYTNLRVGREYTVTGILMDAETGEPAVDAYGNQITSEATFRAESTDGTVEVTFVFDGSLLEGETVVVFEDIYQNGRLYASHEDLTDEGQTVYIPKIHTSAWSSETGDQVSHADGTVTLYDSIYYSSLKPGMTYYVYGILLDAETREPELDAEGNIIDAYAELTPETSTGETIVEFTFDASNLSARRTVFYEVLYMMDDEGNYHLVAVEDVADAENQMIYFPEIHTTAIADDTLTGVTMADDEVTIIDTVYYNEMKPDYEYTLTGVLMNAETGEPLLDAEGNEITSTVTFVPDVVTDDAGYEYGQGTIDMEFTFDASLLAGTTTVVFEDLYHNDVLVATHSDIEDEGQTVYIPEIHTTALDSETNDHMSKADEDITIIDTVEYTNLKPGLEYTMTGTLVDEETGEPILDDNGDVITAEATFTPDEPDGSIEIFFHFSGVSLAGKTVVAFEDVTYLNIPVAVHADINDIPQTVYFPEIHTTALVDLTQQMLGYEDGEEPEDGEPTVAMTLKEYVEYAVQYAYNLIESGELSEEDVELLTECIDLTEDTLNFGEELSDHDYEGMYNTLAALIEEITGAKVVEETSEAETTIDWTASLEDELNYALNLVDSGLLDGDDAVALQDCIDEILTTIFGDNVPDEEITDSDLADAYQTLVDLIDSFDVEGVDGAADGTPVVIETGEPKGETPDGEDEDDHVITHVAYAGDKVIIEDTVEYSNVIAGNTYTVSGVLMDKATGQPLLDADGNEITSEAEFVAEDTEGFVVVEFEFDASLMAGTTTVVFEDLYYEGVDIATHADLTDEGQTIYIPEIHTTAIDSDTLDHISMADDEITIIDTVEYTDLQPGLEYVMTGVLMNQTTGEAMLDDYGDEIVADTTFTPETADGTVDVTFTFSGVSLAGETLVAFESLTYQDIEVAVHADIEDESQTVYVPEIHTTAVAESTGTHEVTAEGTVTIIDTVDYTNLIPGLEYTMSGELMDETTGEGLGITSETVFTPEEPDGSVEMTFTFDADNMGGTTVVVFEYCDLNGERVAEHTDLNDTDQQVKLNAPVSVVQQTTPKQSTPTQSNPDSPKTGEIIAMSILGAMALAALIALAVTVISRRRKA